MGTKSSPPIRRRTGSTGSPASGERLRSRRRRHPNPGGQADSSHWESAAVTRLRSQVRFLLRLPSCPGIPGAAPGIPGHTERPEGPRLLAPLSPGLWSTRCTETRNPCTRLHTTRPHWDCAATKPPRTAVGCVRRGIAGTKLARRKSLSVTAAITGLAAAVVRRAEGFPTRRLPRGGRVKPVPVRERPPARAPAGPAISARRAAPGRVGVGAFRAGSEWRRTMEADMDVSSSATDSARLVPPDRTVPVIWECFRCLTKFVARDTPPTCPVCGFRETAA